MSQSVQTMELTTHQVQVSHNCLFAGYNLFLTLVTLMSFRLSRDSRVLVLYKSLLYGKSGNHKLSAMAVMQSGGLLKEICVPV